MQILSYAAALVVVAAAPGPIVAILLARALAGQRRAAALFAAGVILGKLAMLAAVTSGLILWLGDPGTLLLVAKAMIASYLGTVVLRLWQTASEGGLAVNAPCPEASGAADLMAGLVAGLASPLSLLFFVAMSSAGAAGGANGWPFMLAVAIVTAVAPGLVFGGYVLLAGRLQRVLCRAGHARLLQRAMAALLAFTTVWMIAAGAPSDL